MNDDTQETDDLGERLNRIETHVFQIKLLLGLLVIIALLGLPGVLPALVRIGFLSVLMVGAVAAVVYALLYLLDALFLRGAREKREAEIKKEFGELIRVVSAGNEK